MPFSINEFKSRLRYGGARPNQFEVRLSNPVVPLTNIAVPLMCKAASLPGSSTGSIIAPFMGRQVKFGGDRVFEDWTATFYNDEDFLIRNGFEAWGNLINSHQSNSRGYPQQYKSDANVIQFGKDKRIIKQIQFQGLHPINISEITLGWDQNDQIEEFQVTFQYDIWMNTGISSSSTT